MASIKDVAIIAGVTVTTVSRVLNNRGYISENTRKKVFDAMSQLNYHPNMIARALQRNKSDILAILAPDSNNPFYSGLIKEVESQCRRRDKRILLCNSFADPKLEQEYIKILNGQGIDGLIVCSHTLDIEHYENVPFRLVTFDRALPKVPMVASDNFNGGAIAAKRLIDKGCKNLLHIAGPLDNQTLAGHDRYRGFADYCARAGVKFQLFQTEDKFGYPYYSSFITARLTNMLDKFDGAFCSNDILAYALYQFAISKGVNVPQQLKIIGFDNSYFTKILAEPKITTIAQDEAALAEALVSSLLEEDETNLPPVTFKPVTLVEGTTA